MRGPNSGPSVMVRFSERVFSEKSLLWSALLVLLAVAGIAVHQFRLRTYTLYKDDFAFVARSLTFERWRDHFLDFHAQHWMPVFHTITGLLCQMRQSLTDLPVLLRGGAVLAYVLAGLGVGELAYLLCGSRLAACTASLVFWVTSVHASILQWYAASCVSWSIAFTTAALSLWIRYVSRGGLMKGAGAAIATVLAFGSWSAGILVAPLFLAVLISAPGLVSQPSARRRAMVALLALVVLTAIWIGLLPVVHPSRHAVTDAEGRTLGEAMNPVRALEFTFRRLSEQVLFGNLAVLDPQLPRLTGVLYGLGLVGTILVLWKKKRLGTAPVWTGLAWMILGFCLPMLFRWRVGYTYLRDFDWYGAWPQCGAGLIAAAVVERALRVRPGRAKPPSKARVALLLCLAAVVMFLSHEPIATRRALPLAFPHQRAQLAELELVAHAARQHEIPEEIVREALGPYRIQGAFAFDGLQLLRLPQTGRAWNVEAVRKLLHEVLEYGTVAPEGDGRDR